MKTVEQFMLERLEFQEKEIERLKSEIKATELVADYWRLRATNRSSSLATYSDGK